MRGSGAVPLAAVLSGTVLGWMSALGAPSAARAHDEATSMHRVSFGVERSREVDNDWVRAVVGITEEDPDSARVAERVNEAAQWGLSVAGEHEDVRVESGAYRTYPIAEDGRIRRWRASQEIVIEGPDARAVGELVAALQARLQLRSLTFSVTPERRRAVEDELVAEGLAAFLDRAERVRESLDASSYEIVAISIDTGGGVPTPIFRQQEAALMSVTARAAPALEAGKTRIQISATGTIELD